MDFVRVEIIYIIFWYYYYGGIIWDFFGFWVFCWGWIGFFWVGISNLGFDWFINIFIVMGPKKKAQDDDDST